MSSPLELIRARRARQSFPTQPVVDKVAGRSQGMGAGKAAAPSHPRSPCHRGDDVTVQTVRSPRHARTGLMRGERSREGSEFMRGSRSWAKIVSSAFPRVSRPMHRNWSSVMTRVGVHGIDGKTIHSGRCVLVRRLALRLESEFTGHMVLDISDRSSRLHSTMGPTT
jgi:hypothetical protein